MRGRVIETYTDVHLREVLLPVATDDIYPERREAALQLLLPTMMYPPRQLVDAPELITTIVEATAILKERGRRVNFDLYQLIPPGDVGRAVLFLTLPGSDWGSVHSDDGKVRRSAALSLGLDRRRSAELTVEDACDIAHVCGAVALSDFSIPALVAVGIFPLLHAIRAAARETGWEFTAYAAGLGATADRTGCKTYRECRERVVRDFPYSALLAKRFPQAKRVDRCAAAEHAIRAGVSVEQFTSEVEELVETLDTLSLDPRTDRAEARKRILILIPGCGRQVFAGLPSFLGVLRLGLSAGGQA